ncbi:MAG TPA: putative glycolipid-binding domain-containing protein [Acidimicrobiia bacterium]|nr:putative glycolipid-binding domain-containing protein [Acidimicrobiia bacterium]
MTEANLELLVDRRWDCDLLDSTERFTLHSHRAGYRFTGTTLIRREGIRVEIDYVVDTGPDWSTRSARIDIPAVATLFEVEVSHDRRWVIDGDHRPDLDGCVDIDLGWTPATNTLPIRRLRFKRGIPVTTRVGWLKWSELVFMPAEQTYTKQGEGGWTYASGEFSADLVVDELGVVVDYGDPPIWRAVT